YLGIANALSQQQIQTLDRVDVGINTNMISEFAKLGGGFSNPEVLRGILQTINSGVQNPSNQYAQAMQFAVMSRINPAASRYELMEMQEKGMQDPRILKGVLDQLKQSAGPNQDLFNEQIKAYFPQLSYSQASRLGRSYSSGQLDLTAEPSEAPRGMESFISGRASENTANLSVRTATMDNMLAVKGEEISNQIAKLADTFGGIDGAVGGILDTGISILEGLNRIVAYFGGADIGNVAAMKSNVVKKPLNR
ncbi:MAG: hypothetical protein JHC54_16045, partial [Acinetobacter sp.]|nr:hypothetical protein [Acinetobacter sp.]